MAFLAPLLDLELSLLLVMMLRIPNRHDAVLPWDINTGFRQLSFQNQLAADDYATLMKDELDDLVEGFN